MLVKKCGIPPITDPNENWHCHRRRRLSRLERRDSRRGQNRRQARLGNPRHHRRLRRPAAPQNYRVLDYKALDGLLVRGGTILGTANRGQFSAKTGHGETRQLPKELMDETKRGMETLGISALVSVGGDGSLTIAQQMHEAGIPIVGVPKTIDNDLAATTITFGFDSAVACATDALDRLHTTAESHNRVMVLEVMGRYAGWIAIYAGRGGRRGRDFDSGNSVSLRGDLRRRSWNAKRRENILRSSSRPKARNRRAAIL